MSTDTPLHRRDLLPDPIEQFGRWLAAAAPLEAEGGTAMTLATATSDGRPSARMVLLKGCDQRGFVFYSHYDSLKGQELAENAQAALLFYWPSLHRQVRIIGRVSRLTPAESDAYFHSRPRDSQLSTAASPQSSPVENREWLEEEVARLAAEYEGQEVPRPATWGGYRLEPETMEFWQGRPNRLHDRFRYARRPDGGWLIERLAP